MNGNPLTALITVGLVVV